MSELQCQSLQELGKNTDDASLLRRTTRIGKAARITLVLLDGAHLAAMAPKWVAWRRRVIRESRFAVTGPPMSLPSERVTRGD
jgi:hypothetical protein